ncbi:MAG: ABC transporter permease [Vicinamibacterales bacterium]
MDPHLRWFRRLLRLLPSDLQADYAREMERTFRAQAREARVRGHRGVAALWWETICGLLRTAPREHLEQIAQDARYALRLFRLAPGFAAMAVVTIAVGIGANTAMFSAVHAVLLAPLAFPEPERLVRIYERRVQDGLLRNSASPPNVLDWQQQSTSFTAIAAYRRRSVNLSGPGEPRYVHGARASASFFDILGVSPIRGRTFSETEARQGATVALLSHALWQSQFGGDEGVIGRSFDLDGGAYTVIGVLPPDFCFHLASEVWIPLGLYPGMGASRGSHNLSVIARLAPGRDLVSAQAEMTAIAARLETQYPNTNTGWDVFVEPLRESGVHDVRLLAFVLLGAVGFVLLVACANIGSMLVARAAGRGRELAVRVALGASRARLVRQLLTESLMLAAIGGAFGVAVAAALIDALRRFEAFTVPRLDEAGLHAPVLMATAGLTMMTGVLFGVLPAAGVGRWEATGRLCGASRRETLSRDRRRLQAALNVAQAATAVVLLAGAGVMLRTMLRLTAVDMGFDASGVVAVDLSLSDTRYPRDEDRIGFFRRVVTEVTAAPGVKSAALVSDPPLTGGDGYWEIGFSIDGRPPRPPGQGHFAYLRWITPQYFSTLRVPVLRGRMLSDGDVVSRPLVIVVNDAFARRFFPGEDPIGRRLIVSMRAPVAREVVGVVADIRQTTLDAAPEPQIYLPAYQALTGYGTLLVRTDLPPDAALSSIREAVRRVDAGQPLFNAREMRADVAASVASRRVTTAALSIFAVIALALALLGIYAVAASQVGERTRELGVRMALGARARDIVRMVMRQSMAPAVAGVLIGLGSAALLTRLLSAWLFDTAPLDGGAFAAAAVVLLVTALLASTIPARRATRVDPSTALRAE